MGEGGAQRLRLLSLGRGYQAHESEIRNKSARHGL